MGEVPSAIVRRDTEVKPPKSLVKEKLLPQDFVDDDGTRRERFNFKTKKGENVQVVFYSKEEIPFNKDVVRGKQAFVFGRPPKFRAEQDWKRFLADVGTYSDNKSGVQNPHNFKIDEALQNQNGVFFVENTPGSLLDMAFILGVENKTLRETRGKISTDRAYSNEALAIIDSLTAAVVVNEGGVMSEAGQVRQEGQRGEALVLLALMGDQEARLLLERKREVVQNFDLRNQQDMEASCRQSKQYLQSIGVKPPARVTVCHTTKYKPIMTSEGVEVGTTFDATDGAVLRNTIHHSTGRPVDDALGDKDWEGMDYVVSADLGEMRKVNGNPKLMSEVDTYFTVSPGTRLKYPNAHLTMPGVLPDGVVRETRGNITLYKKGDYSSRDIDGFFMDHYDGKIAQVRQVIQDKLVGKIRAYLNRDVLRPYLANNPSLRSEQQTMIAGQINSIGGEKVIGLMRQQGITDETVDKLLEEVAVDVGQGQRQVIKQKILGWFITGVRNGSLTPQTGHDEDSPEAQGIALLAAEWGTKGVSHKQGHFTDDLGLGSENGLAFDIFKAIDQANAYLKVYDQEAEAARASGQEKLTAPRDMYERISIDGEHISLSDRKGIMAAVNERKRVIPKDIHQRRMFMVAGVI